MRLLRRAGGLLGLAFVAAACASSAVPSVSPSPSSIVVGTAPFIPEPVSSQAVVGHNRLLIGLLDRTGTKPIGTPDTQVQVTFAPSDPGGTTIGPVPATFVWAVPDIRGIFVADVDLPTPGTWTAAVQAKGGDVPAATVRMQFPVEAQGSAVPLGGRAPATKTPTAADVGGDLRQVSTDPNPDPAFYTTSVDQALADHKPFVLVFATPAFCTSRQCGPTLDAVKALSKSEPGMTFIHAEPYKLEFSDGRLQPVLDASGQLQATDAVKAWGILSEPWVFVVDGRGVVQGSFEAVVSADELKAAIEAAP